MISAEESSERFEETDEDEDDFVSWREHLVETFGSSDETEGDDSNTLVYIFFALVALSFFRAASTLVH